MYWGVEEVADLLNHMKGSRGLMARLMYGGGLRVLEVSRLRVQDVIFQIKVFSFVMVKTGRIGRLYLHHRLCLI
ncbi:hypothetical protein SPBRAN_2013 [uncultured Candidatus Thioglobus sp.]|nr:hypothetical protein SPBRAN_2013 [uncultured Candidatus Thioglobus sp.]